LVFTNGSKIIGITLAKPLVTGSVIAAVFVAVSRGTLSVGVRRNTNTLSGLEITKPVALFMEIPLQLLGQDKKAPAISSLDLILSISSKNFYVSL